MKILLAVIVSLIALAFFLGTIVLIRKNKSKEWSTKYLWAVSVILVGIAVLWGLQGTLGTLSQSLQSPSLQTVWETTKDYWMWIFLTFIILFVLAFFLPEEKKEVAAKLQWFIVMLGLLLFVVFPILGLFTGTGGPGQEKVMVLTISAGGKSERIPVPPYMHVVMKGDNFRLHNVYRDGHECAFGEACTDGPLAAVYATNEDTKNPNIVSYSYAPMKMK